MNTLTLSKVDDEITYNMNIIVKIKALLGILARLPLGRRNMIGSMDGRQGRVYLEYAKGLTNKFAR